MRRLPASIAVLLLWLPAQATGELRAEPTQAAVAAELRALLWNAGAVTAPAGPAIQAFYAGQGFAPVWWEEGRWSAEAEAAIKALAAADRHGLDPADYRPRHLAQRLGAAAQADARTVAAADVMLSATMLRFLDDMYNGRIDPTVVGWHVWQVPHGDPAALLSEALSSGRLDRWLAAAGPRSGPYRALRELHERYLGLAAMPWPELADGPTLELGSTDPRILVLRQQLAVLGDLPADTVSSVELEHRPGADPSERRSRSPYYIPAAAGTAAPGGWREMSTSGDAAARPAPVRENVAPLVLFDAELEAAVRRFQARHGLLVDGRVGPGTRAALNVTPRQRLRQIEINLERRRWLPDDLGDRHVVVNIPAFELTAVEGGRVVHRMPVVVGESGWPTPVLSDDIVDLKFAPTWTIPASIVRQEILAQVRRDPGYLERKAIRVFRNGVEVSPWAVDWYATSGAGYVFRQDPGRRNALGRIRFSLTNPQDIYLHDTPATSYFRRVHRALSHGCVRVADPMALAMFVLDGDPAWDRARLERAMNARRTHVKPLDRPVPVHLIYLTAWVDETGTAQFRDDVYGRDDRLAAALAGRPAWTPPLI